MEQFQIIQPSQLLKPYVKQYWFLAIDNAERGSQRYIPSGCAMLAFHRGDRIYSTLHREVQPRSSLCGQSVFYTDIIYSGNLNLIAVVFHSPEEVRQMIKDMIAYGIKYSIATPNLVKLQGMI